MCYFVKNFTIVVQKMVIAAYSSTPPRPPSLPPGRGSVRDRCRVIASFVESDLAGQAALLDALEAKHGPSSHNKRNAVPLACHPFSLLPCEFSFQVN